MTDDFNLHTVLAEQFGLSEFRPGQEEVIRSVLSGRDALAVLPTGAGKSLVFQLPAQLLAGTTIVVSPLLALMQDQVDSLAGRGVAVSAISSAQSPAEAEAALERVVQDEAKLLYVTPERFTSTSFLAHLRQLKIALLVIDEAHCITDWGHSFRPAYLTLAAVASELGRPPLLALTATATPWVRNEIIARLGMRKPAIVVHGCDRPNLLFEVRRVEQEHEDQRILRSLLLEPPPADHPHANAVAAAMQGTGIIYTATTKAAQETAAWLQSWGIASDYYHGQRRKAEREAVQAGFMAGDIRVLVATNAFGMGVDKADVRFVIHRDIPGSLEAYYQEAGRAGRDGEFARCVIIYRPGDLGRAAFLQGSGELTRDEAIQGWNGLVAHPNTTVRDLAAATGLNQADLARLLAILKTEKLISERRGRISVRQPTYDPQQLPLERESYRLAYERSRLAMMRGYAETCECRRSYILHYFGETAITASCTMCDNDLSTTSERISITVTTAIATPFAIGTQVEHAMWGPGVVQNINADSLTVLFETAGYKVLASEIVQAQGLLQARQ